MKERDRSRLISVEISHEAKKIYDRQPHKGEFVSEAIEKHNKSTSEVFSPEQQEWIRKEIASFLSRH
jgi:hypothetical protein